MSQTPLTPSKRGRVAAACVVCRLSRLGCDGQQPCQRCVSGGLANSCVYIAQKKRGRPSRHSKGSSSTGPQAPPSEPVPNSCPPKITTPVMPRMTRSPVEAMIVGEGYSQQAELNSCNDQNGNTLTPSSAAVATATNALVEILSKEVHKAREQIRDLNVRLKKTEEENLFLHRQAQAQGVSLPGMGFEAAVSRLAILSHFPFFCDYDLASSDVPFVVNDMRKPVLVFKVIHERILRLVCFFVNQPFLALSGQSQSDLLGSGIVQCIIFDYLNKVKMISVTLGDRDKRVSQPTRISVYVVHRDGNLLRTPTTMQLLRFPGGKIEWVVCSLEGPSEVETMAGLEISYPRLYKKLVAISQETFAMSHEAVLARKKDLIVRCEREEWGELVAPLQSPEFPTPEFGDPLGNMQRSPESPSLLEPEASVFYTETFEARMGNSLRMLFDPSCHPNPLPPLPYLEAIQLGSNDGPWLE